MYPAFGDVGAMLRTGSEMDTIAGKWSDTVKTLKEVTTYVRFMSVLAVV